MNSEAPDFKYSLKCIFTAHGADILDVKPTCVPKDGLITGSRDNYVKVWAPQGKYFNENHVFLGATASIDSLCVLPPSMQYPKGLYLAGSSDCSIYGFIPDSTEPVLRLLGHSGRVNSLSQGQFGFIVSGSSDTTARLWSGQECISILQGHLGAVWATEVFHTQNLILTGSVDRTIVLWRSGVCEKIFTGHEDCVRQFAIVSDTKFLSCANDNTVRLWSTCGDCLAIYKNRTNFIYSITLLSNGIDFATCDKDQSLKIWKKGDCIQTIVIAPKSLWSVACLSNGDLAVGTSDGKVYIFEKVSVDYFEKASAGVANSFCETVITEGVPDGHLGIANEETLIIYESPSSYMYVCRYDRTTGMKVKKEKLDFKVISNTMYKKPIEGAAAIVDLPSRKMKWTQHISQTGHYYYYHHVLKKSMWEKPDELKTQSELLLSRCPWKEHKSKRGRKYFFNIETKESCWNIPKELEDLKNLLAIKEEPERCVLSGKCNVPDCEYG